MTNPWTTISIGSIPGFEVEARLIPGMGIVEIRHWTSGKLDGEETYLTYDQVRNLAKLVGGA